MKPTQTHTPGPLAALRHHVSGAIERGEKKPIEGRPQRPQGSFVHLPDPFRIVGYVQSPTNRFEFEPIYSDGARTITESEALREHVACYRVQIDRFTCQDFFA